MNQRNYQKELDRLLTQIGEEGAFPRLLLHSCCAPCSSYVLEYLSRYFRITVFYYNPNIAPESEYVARAVEQERLIKTMSAGLPRPVSFICGEYRPEVYYEAVRGYEGEPEGGARCTECFRLRLMETARIAGERGFEYFTTTLSISPLKDADRLNRLGEEAGACYGVPFLNSDFKKKNGYKRSIELSREHGLYRQNYCGCVFSRKGPQRPGQENEAV
ncbi:MAG: epoxyqueuosine reductase QueH [Lachnospiraceae bacterium]|nr:epoxyqueuosine reductase QueH [Lachnospiraceae bacterium]